MAHYSMGGVWVCPADHSTDVDGLYVIGEAASGLHGAKRLGGNSLIELWCTGASPARQLPNTPRGSPCLVPRDRCDAGVHPHDPDRHHRADARRLRRRKARRVGRSCAPAQHPATLVTSGRSGDGAGRVAGKDENHWVSTGWSSTAMPKAESDWTRSSPTSVDRVAGSSESSDLRAALARPAGTRQQPPTDGSVEARPTHHRAPA